ncbi:hypothetical protein TcWFU_000588 [Taenia crassiceps]|uniref:Uncharacterized protein n=1 Tax=Taenia crassiceps TaxID=6207 RepID=A0ABR4QJL4_9CEST
MSWNLTIAGCTHQLGSQVHVRRSGFKPSRAEPSTSAGMRTNLRIVSRKRVGSWRRAVATMSASHEETLSDHQDLPLEVDSLGIALSRCHHVARRRRAAASAFGR